MERRQFLAASLATSSSRRRGERRGGDASAAHRRVFTTCGRYTLQSGPQTKLTESYLHALIPARDSA